ncbi:MAG: carbohydrate kinase family protein [Planctomycetes bacterium]|nr:carbohydrate kinase family protein [Planctomycetota bacterium]
MATDVLILNTGVVDLRRPDFAFADKLVGKGGLAKCKTKDMPSYSQEQLREWMEQGFATAGGPGNTAPLIARTGLKVAVGVNLGKGDYDGLDAQGRLFHDMMTANDIDMSATHVHPCLPTGTTFIHSTSGEEDRGGIAYFPNANNDFDFEIFKGAVKQLKPSIVYYMYSGLSDRGDANEGRDLAEFIKWCRSKGAITIVDSHTLTGNPGQLIKAGKPIKEYRLLEPLLPEVDVFFTSCDEAKLIQNTLAPPRTWKKFTEHENNLHFLNFLTERFWPGDNRTKLFGVTVSNGAYEMHNYPDGRSGGPNKIESRFMAGEVVDLVGAGDSFRAGLITYIAHNLNRFTDSSIDFTEAVQMGNLFASLFIKASLEDRYGNIKAYDKMLKVVRSDVSYPNFEALQAALH